MSGGTTPKNMIKIDDFEAFELSDDQLDAVSGGAYIPETDEFICDKCGVKAEYLGVNHQNVIMFRCPKCGQPYGVW